jgi:hypothetical protein
MVLKPETNKIWPQQVYEADSCLFCLVILTAKGINEIKMGY